MISDTLYLAKRVTPIVLLALLWSWETAQPFFGPGRQRWRHAGRNLALALANTVILAVVFGYATVAVADWTASPRCGLLYWLEPSAPLGLLLTLVLLDGWMYVWHRANHALPLLWRCHRMHHSDPHMDVTTATRFHLGEQVGAALLRLGLIPALGLELAPIILYDTLLLAVTQFHHADISIGRLDRWLRWLIVTPDMHKLHHSNWQPETDSNFATILSLWDRLGGTFRSRADLRALHYGLDDFADPYWQTWRGMWVTPLKEMLAPQRSPESQRRVWLSWWRVPSHR